MHLTVVMAEESGLIAADLGGEVQLIEGGGAQGRWAEQTHLHQGHQRLEAGQLVEVVHQGAQAADDLLLHQSQHRANEGCFRCARIASR